MIHLKFIHSPDDNIIGDYQIAYCDLVISARPGADLLVLDPAIKHSFVFKATNKGLKVTYRDYFLINGKKISGSKVLKPGDVLEIGQTKLEVISSLPSPPEHQRNIIDVLEERVRNHPEISELVVELEKELIRIEQDRQSHGKSS